MALIAALAGAFLALAMPAARAHPHVFIDYSIEPEMKDGAIVGLRLTWSFDELYSSLVVDSVDRDHDGKLSASEIDAIAKRTLKTIEAAKFYSHFTLDGVAWQVEKAQHFTVEINGDRIAYIFTLRLPSPAKTVTLVAYDAEYYIEMTADKRRNAALGAKACRISQSAPVKMQSWGSFQPDMITCGQ